MRGKLLWFNEEKDHGYIATDQGERLYVPGTGFQGGRRPKGRCAGLVVEFDVTDRKPGRQAAGCVVVEEIAPPRARLRRSRNRVSS
jgi:cold shock CspA family protein